MALWCCYNRFLRIKTEILFFCIMHPVLLLIRLSVVFLLPGFKPLFLFGTFLTASAFMSPSPHLLLQLMSLACELPWLVPRRWSSRLEPRPFLTVRVSLHLCQALSNTFLPVVPTCFMNAWMDVFISCSLPDCPTLPEGKDRGCVTQHCGNLEETSGLFNDTHPSPDACYLFFLTYSFPVWFIIGSFKKKKNYLQKSETLLYFLWFYLFIFGYSVSSLLFRLFSSCSNCGLLSSCGVQVSHCGSFSCCRVWALGCTDFSSCGSLALEHRLSSCGPQD